MERVLDETGLNVLNDATPTRFGVERKRSVLYLFFVSSDTACKSEMMVEETSCDSNYSIIRLTVRDNKMRLDRKRVMNWEKYGRKSERVKCEGMRNAEDMIEQYVTKLN